MHSQRSFTSLEQAEYMKRSQSPIGVRQYDNLKEGADQINMTMDNINSQSMQGSFLNQMPKMNQKNYSQGNPNRGSVFSKSQMSNINDMQQ